MFQWSTPLLEIVLRVSLVFVGVFVLLLGAGFVYAWKVGALDW